MSALRQGYAIVFLLQKLNILTTKIAHRKTKIAHSYYKNCAFIIIKNAVFLQSF